MSRFLIIIFLFSFARGGAQEINSRIDSVFHYAEIMAGLGNRNFNKKNFLLIKANITEILSNKKNLYNNKEAKIAIEINKVTELYINGKITEDQLKIKLLTNAKKRCEDKSYMDYYYSLLTNMLKVSKNFIWEDNVFKGIIHNRISFDLILTDLLKFKRKGLKWEDYY